MRAGISALRIPGVVHVASARAYISPLVPDLESVVVSSCIPWARVRSAEASLMYLTVPRTWTRPHSILVAMSQSTQFSLAISLRLYDMQVQTPNYQCPRSIRYALADRACYVFTRTQKHSSFEP
ncbi:hypothetical protein PLICRDRAFT_434887 [Plicaturopsis crispa FD-325 SS-3]|uniref:Uncharacterized protein n=1 Tax=Plicaturopsis crispa FD-325 SS-3 TaxID=944288 RepID=A0A0C9SWW9_PLICR|nr:hypothetical protein PLICRDRAFT_434887 [Plicaturopsis crispa FD-325 SS-3]